MARIALEHIVFAGATAVTVAGAVTGRERWQQVAKPLIALALAVRALRKGRGPDRALLVGGLAAATLGDVLLIDPDDDTKLVQGASSFAVMQCAYTVVLTRHGARPTALAVVPRVLGWAGGGVLLKKQAPQVAAPLAAYGLTLGTATTLASDPALGPSMNVGALLFTGSDALIVVRRLFLRSERARAIAEGVILASYAAAQLFLVESMMRLSNGVDRREGRPQYR
ncbi:lysoplasmalogenase [Antrihabitans stalactiti]|uniref:Lysoplasmalogenase n=1 Tax=Antrihabitans stalactiti TaxID=2584121 RepID=A0A848KJ83_9NOCA|nr:lysoplasmalogenase [Antrihabitans stalactiti]NMN99143.1 lysoplasmalogenase [Antrihabitans stalactiti]